MIGGDDKKKKTRGAGQSTANLYGGSLREVKPKPAKAKKKKPKTINYSKRGKGMKMLCAGYGKGRRTSKSCRN